MTAKVPSGFWKKVKRVAGRLPFVDHAVALYFCFLDPDTALWAKLQIAGALAYFVCPLDAVPDAIPVAGYGDDAAVVTATFRLLSAHVTREHIASAREWLDR
ncbi:MAG: DUF1232 domain-containing protein [Myxococcales bacterium]|nr:DUF1232 domain-containing protein [Myxococcales bacterium]